MSSSFKWNPQGFRDLEKQVEQHLEREVAPRVQAEKLNPLSQDLNGLSKTMAGKPKAEIRQAVQRAFRRYDVEPGDISEIVMAIRVGDDIPTIQTRVAPVHIDPPQQ